MSDLSNKVITIKAKEEKAGPFGPLMKLKDQDGKTYTVFKTKKDGTVSVAWEQMPGLEETVQASYAEEQGEFEGKAYTRRTIRSFNSDIGNGVANAKETHYEPNIASQSESKEEFWDKKAYRQCLWNYWLEQRAGGVDGSDWMDDVWAVFNQIEKDADERFSKPRGWAELGEKLKQEPLSPHIDRGDRVTTSTHTPEELEEIAEDIQESADEKEINTEDIPF